MVSLHTLLVTGLNKPLTFAGPASYKTQALLTETQEEALLYLEAAATLLYDMKRSSGKQAILVSFGTFFRSITGRSVTGTLVNVFAKLAEELSEKVPFWQSAEGNSTDWIEICEQFHQNLHRVQDSALGKKMIKVFNHVIAHTFYHKMGVEIDSGIYYQIEKKYIRPNVWNVLTFADAIVGLLLFLAKAGRQAMLTGSVDAFFVDSVFVSDWLLRANRLRKDSEFLGNPAAVGLDTPTYLGEIESAIEDGKRLGKAFGETQKMLINGVIVELEMIQKRHMSSMCAASFRFCPVGINLFGDSGVGKSFIAKGLFNHYASVRRVKKESAVLYPRNPDDKFYSGFKSSMLGCIYDDVGKHKSSKVMGIDQSLTDLIGAINNIPLITSQAEAADKGKVPFLCEWVGITSNIHDLSVHEYYNNVYAVLRRFPYRIEPVVKEEFRKVGTTQLDPSKVPPGEQYPDCWKFHVCEVVRHDSFPLLGHYEPNGVWYSSFTSLLTFLTTYYEKHIQNQTRLLETVNAMGPEVLCICGLPASKCVCEDIENTSPFIGSPEFIFGSATSVSQGKDIDASEKCTLCSNVRRCLVEESNDYPPLEKMFFKMWLAKTWVPFMGAFVAGQPTEFTLTSIQFDWSEKHASFQDMTYKQKVFTVVGHNQGSELDDDSYLTFEPTIGGKRHFLRDQLKHVHAYIMKYVIHAKWSDKQLAALEVYIYDKAPGYLALGWNDESILKAAYDYVDSFGEAITIQQASEGAVLLRSDLEQGLTWTDAVFRFCSMQVFSRPWLLRGVCYVGSTRAGSYVAHHMLSPSSVAKASVLTRLGALYDEKLKGKNGLVMLIIGVCSASIIVVLIKTAFEMFQPPKGQLALEAMGIKPKRREDEKVNVWRVEERNLTSLSFVANRPNCLPQLVPRLQHNVLKASISTTLDGARVRMETNILVLNNDSFLMNNHACTDNFVITAYLFGVAKEGVQSSFDVVVSPEMIRRMPDNDLAVVTTMALPALFKDIRKSFPKRGFQFQGPCFYIVPKEDGEREQLPVIGVVPRHLTGFAGSRGPVNMMAYTGKPERPTVYGECGSPLVMQTPHGPVIVGIHCAFNVSYCHSHAAPVFYEDLGFTDGLMVQVGEVAPAVPISQGRLLPSSKLYTDYHKEGRLVVFGQLDGFRPRPKANGGRSMIFDHVMMKGPELGLLIEDRLTQPDMGSWEPQQNILKEYLTPTHSMNEPLFRVCVESFAEHITSGLTEADKEDIHVVPISVAVNGFPGIPNVDALKFNTSAGHGRRGCKRGYLESEEPLEDWSTFRVFNADLVAEIEAIVEKALVGTRSHPIFTAQLKDEMVSLAKKMSKKTRGFYMCPVAFLVAMRMFTMGLTRVMVRRRKLFRHAVGLNTHSEEWDDLWKSSEKIPGGNWMAGDFKGFDKILSILIQNGAKAVILEIARFCNWSPDHVLALDTLLSDNITAVVDFFGVLIMLLGGEVSGHQMTTFFNSLCNILLHLYAWVVLAKKAGADPREAARSFWVLVFICVLGDDIMAKIHPEADWYNHTTVQEVFESIGITYTMADKRSVSIPYIPESDVGFLKRRFGDHELFPGLKVAPLDQESIYKMLLYTIPSGSVSAEEQLAMSICSAKAEAFYHGIEFFRKIELIIDSAPKSPELEARMAQFPAPSWNGMYERFLQASPSYRVLLAKPELLAEESPTPTDSYCPLSEPEAQASWRVDPWGSTAMEWPSEESFQTRERLSSKKIPKPQRIEKNVVDENLLFTKNTNITQKVLPPRDWEMAPVEVKQAINKVTLKITRRNKRNKWWGLCVAQADVRPDTEGSVTQTQQTYVFANEPTSVTVGKPSATLAGASSLSMPQDLGRYLSRPRLLSTFTWTEAMATGLQATIQPWNLHLTNASMREKLQGYGLFRGNLHLKFIVNGSPFYYGGLMASYTPLSGVRTDTAVGGGTNCALVANSQKPHVWLNVQNTSMATMVLPFLYPYPYLELTAAVLTNMGKVDFYVYSGLRSANGVTGSAVDVQVFGWVEDVELTGPTNLPVAQSKTEYHQDGQISALASNVASVAGLLSTTPVIGPYALATQEAASAVGAAASLFGFTNVPNVSDIAPMMQRPFELASTQISAPIDKLSLQPKQETALGAVQHGGSSDDELVISRFAGRESFLVGSLWSTSAVPGDILYTSAVIPWMRQSANPFQAFTPMGWLSQAFQYWRGDINFTVKCIRSKYHRGRIQLSWDRTAQGLDQGSSLGNPNTFSTILDLDETDEVTFRVPYLQAKPFLTTRTVGPTDPLGWSTSSTPPAGAYTDSNGIFNIRVMNRLTAPEATSDVTLLMFVSAADNIEFAGPRNLGKLSGSSYSTMSLSASSVAQSAIEYEEPEPETSHMTVVAPDVYKEVFGEKISSLREYLHRISLVQSYVQAATFDGVTRQVTPIKHMPASPGLWNNATTILTTPLGSYGNLNQQHPIPYIANCFIGYKGSVNVVANYKPGGGALLSGYTDHLAIDRVPDASNLSATGRRPYRQDLNIGATLVAGAIYANGERSALSGRTLTNTRTNASISANLPYYSNSGFYISDLYTTYNNTDTLTDANNDWWELVLQKPTSTGNRADNIMDLYYGTGPDFDVVYFINVPLERTITMS